MMPRHESNSGNINEFVITKAIYCNYSIGLFENPYFVSYGKSKKELLLFRKIF